MKDIVSRAGQADRFYIASAATTENEIWGGVGNPVYPPMQRVLASHGLSCEGKRAVLLTRKDYSCYDYLIGMDNENLHDMKYICGGDPEGKMSLLMSWTGEDREVSDPWYTRDFEAAYRDIVEGCKALFEKLTMMDAVTAACGGEKIDSSLLTYSCLDDIIESAEELGLELDYGFHDELGNKPFEVDFVLRKS